MGSREISRGLVSRSRAAMKVCSIRVTVKFGGIMAGLAQGLVVHA
jgi:hypothetical protein